MIKKKAAATYSYCQENMQGARRRSCSARTPPRLLQRCAPLGEGLPCPAGGVLQVCSSFAV